MTIWIRVKQKLPTILRFTIAFLLLGFLIIRSDFQQMFNLLNSAKTSYLMLVFGLIMLDAVLRSYSWKILLSSKSVAVSLPQLLYVYMTGGFFGTFIPSSLGVDISRIMLLSKRYSVKVRDSAVSILVTSLVSLLALCMFAFISAFILSDYINNKFLPSIILAVSLSYTLIFLSILKGRFPRIKVFEKFGLLQKLVNKMAEFSAALNAFGNNKKSLLSVLAIALVSQSFAILIVYIISLSLNLNIPFGYFAIFVPVITLSRLIPLSVAGFGAEQGIFVYLFYQVGVPETETFLTSIMLATAVLCFTLLGGLIYVFENFGKLFKKEYPAT